MFHDSFPLASILESDQTVGKTHEIVAKTVCFSNMEKSELRLRGSDELAIARSHGFWNAAPLVKLLPAAEPIRYRGKDCSDSCLIRGVGLLGRDLEAGMQGCRRIAAGPDVKLFGFLHPI
jgi:hypothetical protein